MIGTNKYLILNKNYKYEILKPSSGVRLIGGIFKQKLFSLTCDSLDFYVNDVKHKMANIDYIQNVVPFNNKKIW